MSLSEEEADFIRLVILEIKVAPKAVRYLFNQRFPPSNLAYTLQNNLLNLNKLKNSRRLNAAQWNLLFPPSGNASCSSTYDVTLLICLLRNIVQPRARFPCVLEPPTGFDRLPPNADLSEGADLARIKHYRNYIFHHNEGKIARTDFNLAWTDLSGAISRLGAGNYNQECSDLRVASLDGSDRELSREVLKQQSELESLQKEVEDIKKDIERQADSIPEHMKVKYASHIKEWEKDEEKITVTRATDHVANLIEENDVVVVTGSSGSGKSSIIHHVALELYRNKGYDIIPFVTSAADIINYRDMKKNQVFVVDDACGKNFIDEQDLQSWKKESDKIEKLFPSEPINEQDSENLTRKENNGMMKILVSCRLQISKDDKFKSLKIFTKQTVDLQSEEHCLLLKEKRKMIKKYIAKTESDLQEMDKMFEKYSYFPLLCKMSNGKQVEQLTELFSSPVESIKNDIKDLIEYKQYKPLEYCALVLCVLFPNELEESYMNPRTTPENVKEKVTKIVANFRIDLNIELERKQLVDTFNKLDGTYIKKTGSVYSIAHDKLYDMVAVTCGQKLVELFIKYSPSSFIAEGFRLLSGQNLEQDDSFLYLSEDTENVYFDRIFRDLKKRDGRSFFYNQQLKEKRYKDKVMGYIKEHTDSCKQLFLELDDKGLIDKNRQYYTSTPMIEASKIGSHELVNYLISIKCNVYKKDSYGLQPLFYCCENGHVNIVDLLITNGVNIQDVLCDACLCGNINIVRMALERNADVSHCGGRLGETPLYAACEEGHTDNVQLLLDRNADVSQCGGRWGETPLYGAYVGGHTDIVQLLLVRNADVSQCGGRWGETPLYVACVGGHTDIVQLLLDRNADVSQCSGWGETPLYVACKGGHTDIVQLLLDRNADVSQCNSEWGGTPLYVACDEGHTDIVQLLLDRNADVSQCSGLLGVTPLYVACVMGHTNIVQLLLDRNADVSQCGGGEVGTPLYVACMGGHTDIVQLLLDRNTDVSQCGGWGETPLYVACEKGYTDIVQLLLDRNADVSQCGILGETPLYVACVMGHTNIVQLLLDRNADVSQCGILGETPLYVACVRGHTDIVQLLLDRNADVSQCGGGEVGTPLYVACMGGHTDIVQLLLENNADPRQRVGRRGLTPLDVASNETIKNLLMSYIKD